VRKKVEIIFTCPRKRIKIFEFVNVLLLHSRGCWQVLTSTVVVRLQVGYLSTQVRSRFRDVCVLQKRRVGRTRHAAGGVWMSQVEEEPLSKTWVIVTSNFETENAISVQTLILCSLRGIHLYLFAPLGYFTLPRYTMQW